MTETLTPVPEAGRLDQLALGSKATDDALRELLAWCARAEIIPSCRTLAFWDQVVGVPSAGQPHRAEQMAVLGDLYGQQVADPRVDEWLSVIEASPRVDDPEIAAIVRVLRRDHERVRRVPAKLAAAIGQASSQAIAAWGAAREAEDFSVFCPHLERMIVLKQEEADALLDGLSPVLCRHDAFLESVEPGFTTAECRTLADDLVAELQPLIDRLPLPGEVRPLLDGRRFPVEGLRILSARFAEMIGLDRTWARCDPGIADYCSHVGHYDVRVVVRCHEDDLPGAILQTAHEAGHGFYRHGLDVAAPFSHPLTGLSSFGLDEAGARLWEAIICKLPEFWASGFPLLRDHFPSALAGVSPDDFARATTYAVRGGTRARTDDICSSINPAIKMDLEVDLLDGSLAARDVREAFDTKYQIHFGGRPSLLRGILGDPHWAANNYGYYPAYLISSVRAGQLFAAIERSMSDVRDLIANGEFAPVHEWLQENIYRHGRAIPAEMLMDRATGTAREAGPWVKIMHERYDQ